MIKEILKERESYPQADNRKKNYKGQKRWQS